MKSYSSTSGFVHLQYIDSETNQTHDCKVNGNELVHLKYVDSETNETRFCLVEIHQISASLLDGKIRKVVQIFLPDSPKVETEQTQPLNSSPSKPLQSLTQHSMISAAHKVGLLITGFLLLTVIAPFFLQPGSWPFYAVVGFGITDCLIFSGLLITLACKSRQIPESVDQEPIFQKQPAESSEAISPKQSELVRSESSSLTALKEERFELDICNSEDLDALELDRIISDGLIILSDRYFYNLRAKTDFQTLKAEFGKPLRDSSGPFTRKNFTFEDSRLFDRAKARLNLW